MRKTIRIASVFALLVSMLSLAGCSGNVGVGVSVGVPVGNYGYMSIGTSRWYLSSGVASAPAAFSATRVAP
jgi:hypothetical protein